MANYFRVYEALSGPRYSHLIGRKFFYADEETGVGWESKIDEVFLNENDTGYTLELSCGTRVKIAGSDILFKGEKAFYTNLKD